VLARNRGEPHATESVSSFSFNELTLPATRSSVETPRRCPSFPCWSGTGSFSRYSNPAGHSSAGISLASLSRTRTAGSSRVSRARRARSGSRPCSVGKENPRRPRRPCQRHEHEQEEGVRKKSPAAPGDYRGMKIKSAPVRMAPKLTIAPSERIRWTVTFTLSSVSNAFCWEPNSMRRFPCLSSSSCLRAMRQPAFLLVRLPCPGPVPPVSSDHPRGPKARS